MTNVKMPSTTIEGMRTVTALVSIPKEKWHQEDLKKDRKKSSIKNTCMNGKLML
ncbi:hypothetical protein [Calorimonas adulescens]|uniref:hypothetical protein n=1 Tax=Calorimonas adulescens TaxID=2606906 RepID=UPI00193AC9A5|nr:hypothetical protein [Calorimonas adulescens]